MDTEFLAEYVHGRHTVRDYFDRFVGEPVFDHAFAECPDVRSRCTEHLWSAFAELDAVPRTDAFWAGSNMRTTFGRVRDFYSKSEPLAEGDLKACWRSFAIALCHGDLDRFRLASEVLLRTGELSVSEFIPLSLNMLSVSGWDTDELAVEVPLRVGMAGATRNSLNAIIDGGPSEQAEWARKVLRRLLGAG